MPMNYINRLDLYCQQNIDNIWSKPSWYFKGDSNYWRVTRLNSEASELAGVLRSLTTVVGHIGMNVGRITWAGDISIEADRESIVLQPDFVMGDYPVPPGKMDVLTGVCVHEAIRQSEWSGFTWKEAMKQDPSFDKRSNFMKKDRLWKLFGSGENIYLEECVSNNILGDYTKHARKILILGLLRDPKRNPTAWHLFDLWEQRLLDGKQYADINPLYEEPLNCLIENSKKLKSIAVNRTKSVITRCQSRATIFLEMFAAIEPMIKTWERDPVSFFEYGKIKIKKKKKNKKKEKVVLHAISPDLWEDIDLELSKGSKDLTPLIKHVCNNDRKVLRTTMTNFTIPANAATDRQLVGRLKNIFQYYAQRVKKVNRGLESGKIDRRRLYRALIDKRCFKIEQMLPEFAWNFSVVVDASMSMAGFKWKVVESTMNALHKSLEGYQNNLKIYGYFEWDGVCLVSELLRENMLYSIAPTGRTPSGQGIIAAALFMPRKTKQRKFILHITDGESNAGADVDYALDYCKQENIETMTLGCSYNEKDKLIKQYGKQLQFLDTIDELPKAIERLFQRILKF
ncbi:MAG: VWA domain-containing protein [Desulfosarcina sp.]|nr:VWA domain-containing protein [Desulfobacterales bacterium]